MDFIELFPWQPVFDTGLPDIDRQHQQLAALLNALAGLLASEADAAKLSGHFDEFAQAAACHIGSEPSEPSPHTGFQADTDFLKALARVKTAPGWATMLDALPSFSAWLAGHILGCNRQLASTLTAPPALSGTHPAAAQDAGPAALQIVLQSYRTIATHTVGLIRQLNQHRVPENVLDKALASSPIASRITSLDGGIILYANPCYANLINTDIAQVIGSSPKPYYANPSEYDGILAQLNQGQTVKEKLIEIVIPNLGTVWMRATYLKVDYQGQASILGWFYDVTNIHEIEAQLHFLATHSTDVISRHDREGRFLSVTPACLMLLGFKEIELLGHCCFDFFHPDDVAGALHQYRQAQAGSETATLSYRLRHKQGHYVWVESIVRTLHDTQTNMLSIVASTRDISTRKHIEDSLAEAYSLLKTIIDTVPMRIFWKDRESRYLGCNPVFAKDAGVDAPEAVLGKNDYELSWKDQAELYRADDAAVIANGLPKLFYEEPQTHPDGTMMWLSTAKVPLRNANQDIVGVLGVYQDITEQKKIEAELRKLSMAVEQSPSSIVITDLDANIEFVNEAFVRETGYSRAEALGKNPKLLQSGRTPQATYDDMWQTLARNECWKGEFINKRKDGREYIEVALVSPMRQPDGHISHYIAIKDDITERKQMELALHNSNQQLSSLLNSMAEGAYGVDTNGYCTFVNRSFLDMLGFASPDEVIGRHIHALIHHSRSDGSPYPASQCRMYSAYQCNHEVHVTDEVFWRKDGTPLPVEYWSEPIVTDGVMMGAVATFVDITERQKAEEARQIASQYARSLIEASLDPLVTISSEGKITDVNTATEQITGVGRDNLIGSDFADYCTDPSEARKGYLQVFSQGFVTDYPLAIRHSSGKITDVLYNATVYRDKQGKVLGVFAAARDITERKQIEAKLRESEARFRAIFDNEPECIKIVDDAGRLRMMNRAGLAMIEADGLEQVLRLPVSSFIAPKYRKRYGELQRKVLAGEPAQMEFEILGLKGACRWLETHAVPMREADDRIVQLSVTRDITERKKAELQLRIAAAVFESQEGMMVTDADRVILRVNKAFTDITGYEAKEIMGQSPNLLKSDRHGPEFYAAMWESVHTTGTWKGEVWSRRRDGEVYAEHLTITAVKDQEGQVSNYVGTLIDITDRKAAEAEIQRLAYYDPLTNLPNRRLLQDRLKMALAVSHRIAKKGALLFIDLDNFKMLNDTYGHDMGDVLLQQVAARLVACVREMDTVARLGGDEFVVMLEALSPDLQTATAQADMVGNKILAALNRPFAIAGLDYRSTPSIGVALFNGHDHSVDDLLKFADIAMYQAKASGRNALRFFDQKMQEAITQRVALEYELHNAIKQGQFELYYQVQVDAAYQPVGAEALLRWVHPVRGVLAPGTFIPLAEETGLILPIGEWVLESVCAQLQAWQQNPCARGLKLSLNVSGKQFFQPSFVAQIMALINKYAINPALLKLELTESLLLENIDETAAKMGELGKIGVGFALDDFGTGYSSLQYLKKLPLTQLKIDQSFVQDIGNDNNGQVIACTVIAMAESLHLDVIAEGVETESQRQFLLTHGCTVFQGYLFGKPIPVKQFEHWISGNGSGPPD